MGKHNIKVGIIGGTGLEDIAAIMEKHDVKTVEPCKWDEFGNPSGECVEGSIAGVPVALISRHGPGHTINPSQVNYRANIYQLMRLGCTHILATTACGSLSESIVPGQLVVPDGFIDRTHLRKGTMFDGTSKEFGGVCHVPMEPAFDPKTSNVLVDAARELGIDVKKGGTVITIEGPRFSSKAESKLFQLWGGDLVNMTVCPEVTLAKECGLLYAAVAMATDYDCWRDSDERVCVSAVMSVFKKNVRNVTDILIKAVELIGQQDWDQDIDDLKKLVEGGNTTSKN